MGYFEPILDLNSMDNTTINATSEYFDLDRVIFLSNMTEFQTPNGVYVKCTALSELTTTL